MSHDNLEILLESRGMEDLRASSHSFIEATKAIYTFSGISLAAITAGYSQGVLTGGLGKISVVLFLASASIAVMSQYLFFLSKHHYFAGFRYEEDRDSEFKLGYTYLRIYLYCVPASIAITFSAILVFICAIFLR